MKNSFFNKFVSFYKRRIEIPVGRNDLVLDLGSGDKPHWRADVLLDFYIDEKFGNQRSGDSKTAITKPLIIANVENMPFKDKIFDFVICSHLLEHVQNPGKAINEIVRVGKAGYIELPYEGSAKLLDFPTHLWYCRKEKNTLVFTAKKNIAFDKEIDKLLENATINTEFSALGGKYFDLFSVQFPWKNRVAYKVNGKANMKILNEAEDVNIRHGSANFKIRNFLILLTSIVFFYKKNNKKIDLEKILRCNKCKNSIEQINGKIICKNCGNRIKLVEKK